jgi:SAM-dependent methyltransferase
VDNSENMLRFARNAYAARHNLSFAFGDVQRLTFDNEFDIAVSAFCIQWLADKSAAFLGIRASLRPAGKALLIMPFRNQVIAGLRKRMTRDARWQRFFVDYVDPTDCLEDTQYERYAREAGLAVKSYTMETTAADFPAVPAFTDFLSALTPHLVRLPGGDEKRLFMEELVTGYLEAVPPPRTGSIGATYVYDCAILVAEAQ